MNKKKIFLLLVCLVTVFLLTGCSSHTNEPIVKGWDGNTFFTNILVKPIAYIMDFFINLFGGKGYFAVGILFTTILVRTIAWPIYAKSNDMSVKMQLMQPEINRVQAKYAGKRDPESQQKMTAETMALYRKYGVNFLSCLLPFIQMPLFIAMYNVTVRFPLANTEDKVNLFEKTAANMSTNFMWIDLSSNKPKEIWLLPILVGITMAIQTYISMQRPKYAKNIPSTNPQQQQQQQMMKYIQYFMVFMMVMMSFSSGALAFYWVVGNTYSIIQCIIGRKLSEKKYYKLERQNSIIG